ncbi:hypothetical protein GOP47_0006444 [Adiantum capillus-veneris]|uniref:Plant heme peroxidase family profile domain-containing protein n=1 Tax=Adiantum capillus-veneris TaxID=13818 RepID=A0A9D4ZKA8_ADICA|nr:hypothetical protein GOP47_0006444 [Adiantum capillus-veneris]
MASFSFLTSLLAALLLYSLNAAILPTSQGLLAAAATARRPHTAPPPPPPPRRCITRVIHGKPRTLCAPINAPPKKRRVVVPPPKKKVAVPPKKRAVPVKKRVVARPPAPPTKIRRVAPRKAPVIPRPSPAPLRSNGETLTNDYYAHSCPQVESIIRNKVTAWVKKDRSLAASLLRLHFHDCMATGNDASILLKDPKGKSTEMYSVFSKGLRGFEVVDDIKLAVENACPGVVSCADVLTVIARDVTLELHGPFWFVPFGRKDSLTSHINDAAQVPHQESDANTLLKQFTAFGLSFSDLATLTGAHSVGKSHCFSFTRGGAAGANPRMNATYAQALHEKCKRGPWEEVFNDEDTPFLLDLEFYKNLKRGNVLLKSDNSIYVDNNMTSSLVDAFLTQPGMWDAQFAVSMVKLGNVQVLTGRQGEVRRVCSVPNSARHQ